MVVCVDNYCVYFSSHYLWSISKPGRSGIPGKDLSEDVDCSTVVQHGLTAQQLLYERVITKTFCKYSIPLSITDNIRTTFKSKLWRLGKSLSATGGKKCAQLLNAWKSSSWEFKVNKSELINLLDSRKRKYEAHLYEESCKRQRLESTVQQLTDTVSNQTELLTDNISNQTKLQEKIAVLEEENKNLTKAMVEPKKHPIKPWNDCTRQQKYNRKKVLAHDVEHALNFCEEKGFKAHSVEFQNVDTGQIDVLDISTGTFSGKENCEVTTNSAHSLLYVKDKFSISDKAFHELSSITPILPKVGEVKKIAKKLNSEIEIKPTPNNIIGVQQSLRLRLTTCLSRLIEQASTDGKDFPNKIGVKLTGDGTRIARGLNIINFAFTILEDNRAQSASGNHVFAILKTTEGYDEILAGLQDICDEARDIEVISIDQKVYQVTWFLGGDWKFLALVCGLDNASSNFSCIWCKCPKSKRSDMTLQWSINDSAEGARSVEEISHKAKLSSNSKNRFNCSNKPIFSFIPMERVVIDHLHLFLRISDVLITLLIRDLEIVDDLHDKLPNKKKGKSLVTYKEFLNGPCKIKFAWYIDKESKRLKCRDLTGPEKIRLFENIDFPKLFPTLPNTDKVQKLWKDFYSLVQQLRKPQCDDIDQFERSAKTWVTDFVHLYQSKDVTPYMHAFSMHVSQFLRLHGNISSFTQQGLEKVNDITTKFYQRASNHHDFESLQQILQKHNRLETLEHRGFSRTKLTQKCSACKSTGHNKRSCKSRIDE